MSAAKKNSGSGGAAKQPGRSLLFSPWIKTAILCVGMVGLFAGAFYMIWRQVAPKVLASREYYFGPQELEITPPPPWVPNDLCVEVYRELNRNGPPSIMDEDLLERVSQAFSRNPWVAKVGNVSRAYPARVKVELTYRKPVCMVELPGGLMPVDVEGILLPTTIDSGSQFVFTSVEAAKYPRLVGVDQGPTRPAGNRWGDSRVIGGAEIANALFSVWDKFELQAIVPVQPSEPERSGAIAQQSDRRLGEYQFVILTRRGGSRKEVRILWGQSPAANMPGLPTPQEKVRRLEQIFAEHGSLAYPQGPGEIDLRR
jgi:hypothetical protein